MKSARYSVSRQKACQQCSASKAKCDRVESGCSRCVQRDLPCAYSQVASPREAAQHSSASNRRKRGISDTAVIDPAASDDIPAHWDITGKGYTQPVLRSAHSIAEGNVTSSSESTSDPRHIDSSLLAAQRFSGSEIQDFLDLKLTCPINVEDVRNRWLGAYIPLPDQAIKAYPASIKTFLHRMVKSYVTVTIRGRGYPPFIHSSQVAAHLIKPPLSTCLSLVRICEHQLPGSEGVAVDVLRREMSNLLEHRETYDTITLLCAFQAYLTFTMVLFFRLEQIANPFLREAVMNLQELACASGKRGLVCEAEQQWHRPRWESWIVAEANRRTLYTMYLFDGILSAHDGLPTLIGTELRGLPAPASQAL
ncbi:hypothetical protein HD806DRAFT_481985 [Xylariaceae sp. AK1471]|nr:hypothetical protein HD806DRAFT_481985 [Xylariaceae sp. AK1471]